MNLQCCTDQHFLSLENDFSEQQIEFSLYFIHLLQTAYISNRMRISYASVKEKVKYMNGIQINSLNLVVILFPLLFLFFALCLSTVVFWTLGPCLWISMVVFGVLILCLSSRTDVQKTMDRLNQGGRNSLLLHFSQILWKVSNTNFCINFIVELFVLIKNVKKKSWIQGMVIYKLWFLANSFGFFGHSTTL